MMISSIFFFTLTAMLGVVMLSYLLKGKHIPKGFSMLHGPLAVTGIVLLIIHNFQTVEDAWLPVGIFAAAAIGGFILLHRDLTGTAPKWLGIAHGLIAVTGFLILLGFAFSS